MMKLWEFVGKIFINMHTKFNKYSLSIKCKISILKNFKIFKKAILKQKIY